MQRVASVPCGMSSTSSSRPLGNCLSIQRSRPATMKIIFFLLSLEHQAVPKIIHTRVIGDTGQLLHAGFPPGR